MDTIKETPDHLFKPGNSGKPKGASNKVNKLVKDFVAEVFNILQEDPAAQTKRADLKSWAMDNPKDFYSIAAKLIPVQMQHSGEIRAAVINIIQPNGEKDKPLTDAGN